MPDTPGPFDEPEHALGGQWQSRDLDPAIEGITYRIGESRPDTDVPLLSRSFNPSGLRGEGASSVRTTSMRGTSIVEGRR